MKPTVFLICLVFLFSCESPDDHKLWVENQSSLKIDSVVIQTLDISVSFPSIESKKELSKIYSIKKGYNSEGAFMAKIYLKDTMLLFPSFGYYSNTKDIKTNIGIVVENNFRLREKSF